MAKLLVGDCLDVMHVMDDKSVDLVLGSPPYESQRDYGIGFKLKGQAWVDWAVERFMQCVRVCRGPVVWVVGGRQNDFRWSATPALMMADLHRAGISLRTPAIYERDGVPGSGGPDGWKNRYEFLIIGSRCKKFPWSDKAAMGHPPVCPPGGPPSHRKQNGKRVTKKVYNPPELANPGNIIRCGPAGGGNIGSALAHENEAPFPEYLAEYVIRTYCPPLVCSACCTAIQSTHEDKTHKEGVSSVRQPVPDVGVSAGSKQILQQGVSARKSRKAEGELPAVRTSDRQDTKQCSSEVLREGVLKQVDIEAKGDDQISDNDSEGVCDAVHAVAPAGGAGRVCNGASDSHGDASGEDSGQRRGRASHKRNKKRQSPAELGADVKVGTRQSPQTAQADRVPEVWTHDRAKQVCPSCGADLTAPRAVRPGVVLDPFCGSGTTMAVAERFGRASIGIDIRHSQIDLSRRRMEE